MNKSKSKSKLCSIILFISLIIYCIVSLRDKFNYLDLSYLVVVVVSFIRYLYLKRVK